MADRYRGIVSHLMKSFGDQSIKPELLTLFRSKRSNNEPTMQYQLGALATCAAVFAFVVLRRRKRLHTIRDIPGPANPSWIFGMSPEG